VQLIAASCETAFQTSNTTLIDLYWEVGATISRKIEAAEWGDGVVEQLADYIARTQPGPHHFTRANLFRMRQFYETYNGDKKVAPLVRQSSWSHHLIILGQSKRAEERDFYMRIAIQGGGANESWNVISTPRSSHQKSRRWCDKRMPRRSVFSRTPTMWNFPGCRLPMPNQTCIGDLLGKLTAFLTELGRDFCFIGSEYPL